MINLDIDGCSVDILPIIRGLVSEAEKVISALNDKKYDCAAVSLGADQVEQILKRAEAEEEYPDVADLDAVYADFLMNFGTIDLPIPAYVTLVDLCDQKGIELIPLDMGEELYAELYCKKVSTMQLFKEDKVARKALKHSFDLSSAEDFVLEWDNYVNRKLKGLFLLNMEREAFIADTLVNSIGGHTNMLAVIELERLPGIMDLIGDRKYE